MSDLILLTLAVFGVWEFALVVVPWTIPPWLQPLLVYAGALALAWPDWRTALAVVGGVGLAHVWVRNLGHTPVVPPQQVVRRPRNNRMPDLP